MTLATGPDGGRTADVDDLSTRAPAPARADDATVERARRGEADAWRDLYHQHARRLALWLRALPTGDASVQPEDLAAEAWLVAASRIEEFEGTSAEFGGWLFGIARHLAANIRRRSLRRATVPVDTSLLDGPQADLDPVTSMGWVAWLLAQLSDRERQVMACMEVVGLDATATGRLLGMSSTAVRVTRHRALRRLRALATGAEDLLLIG